ncbi:MAG: iron-sulfur cluster assembly protein [Actinomycetota bacterium]|nr:iron-sulfur cluster assembly protein [Actinomycetota bacterium]
MPTKDEVVEALRRVENPELGMDIVELGLLYDVEVEGPKVKVIHSLTSMGRWVDDPGGHARRRRRDVPGRRGRRDRAGPPWTPDRMSDDAKFILGFR